MRTLIIIFSFLFVQGLNAQNNDKNIFDIARSGTLEEAQNLVSLIPDAVNQTDSHGFSPLILACYRGNIEVAKYLLKHVKDINYLSREGSALAAVSVNYNKEMVQELLEYGADPNLADSNGTTPLFWATKSGNIELAELLIKYHADKNLTDGQGKTAFEYALLANNEELVNILKQ